MLSKLPPRERQIVDILYERGPVAVSDICEALPDPLSGSAVRAMLKRLEDKGYVTRADSERGYLYSPVVSDSVAKKSALSEIVRVFFNGSPASAASALLGMSERLKEDELNELEQMSARPADPGTALLPAAVPLPVPWRNCSAPSQRSRPLTPSPRRSCCSSLSWLSRG